MNNNKNLHKQNIELDRFLNHI